MSKLSIRVIDTKTNEQIDDARIGFVDINAQEHYGRQHITVLTQQGDKIVPNNVGILNRDGSVEEQPGYKIEVERE